MEFFNYQIAQLLPQIQGYITGSRDYANFKLTCKKFHSIPDPILQNRKVRHLRSMELLCEITLRALDGTEVHVCNQRKCKRKECPFKARDKSDNHIHNFCPMHHKAYLYTSRMFKEKGSVRRYRLLHHINWYYDCKYDVPWETIKLERSTGGWGSLCKLLLSFVNNANDPYISTIVMKFVHEIRDVIAISHKDIIKSAIRDLERCDKVACGWVIDHDRMLNDLNDCLLMVTMEAE